jgi:hypothetical protein
VHEEYLAEDRWQGTEVLPIVELSGKYEVRGCNDEVKRTRGPDPRNEVHGTPLHPSSTGSARSGCSFGCRTTSWTSCIGVRRGPVPSTTTLHLLLVLAGLGQIGLIVGSLAIPRVLRWHDELEKVKPLTRQVFWTYAAYIWTTNLCFGLLSALTPSWLLDPTPLAGAVSTYIAAYWGARLAIQFLYFDRGSAPKGRIFVLAEVALVILFLSLTLIYGSVAISAFMAR